MSEIRLTLHLDPGEDGRIVGWLRQEGETPQRFEGWLELMSLLQGLDGGRDR